MNPRRASPLLAACLLACGAGYAADTLSANDAARCGKDEDTYRALKLTKLDRAIRVDYQLLATGKKSWTNMDAALLRQFKVKVGATFCMARDTESAQATDYE